MWWQRWRRRWLLVCGIYFLYDALISVTSALVAIGAAKNSSVPRHETNDTELTNTTPHIPDMILKLGWTESIHRYRLALVAAAVKLKDQDDDDSNTNVMVNVGPFLDLINLGIDTFGIDPMYTQVFQDSIEWYFPREWYRPPKSDKKQERCDWHGIGCDWYDLWWIWHYVGAVTAEKLLHEKSLLLDGITGKRVDNAIDFMDTIHRMQEQPVATRMSFHAEHGFIWHYLAATMPNLNTYPTQLAHDFCGKYSNDSFYVPSVNKYIGVECYHGFGHAIYEILAVRQLRGGGSSVLSNYSASRVLRAQSGFELTDEAFCQGYRICEQAPEDANSAKKHCHGGMAHASWLFSTPGSLPRTKSVVDVIFKDMRDVCESKQGS